MFQVCIPGDAEAVRRLVAQGPVFLRRGYRIPNYCAIRKNRDGLAHFLLAHEAERLDDSCKSLRFAAEASRLPAPRRSREPRVPS